MLLLLRAFGMVAIAAHNIIKKKVKNMTSTNIARLLLGLIPSIYMVTMGHDTDISKIAGILEATATQLRNSMQEAKGTDN